MNILYIIGNGLDIAHHLKTSYQEFFQHYLAIQTKDVDIASMKTDIEKNRYKTWSDLEIGLGLYSGKCSSKEVFLKCLADLKTNLKRYLEGELEKIKLYDKTSLKRLYELDDLFEPEPLERYRAFLSDYPNESNDIDIITLNYTPTLEAITGFEGTPVRLNAMDELNSILHVHGTLDNMMTMGVNDASQIANASLSSDIDVIEEFIKPEYNDACMNNKNNACKALIEEADIIVIYGSSVGPSDDIWWKLIGKRLVANDYPLLVYLPFDENKNLATEPNRLRRWTLAYISEIKEKFDISLPEEELFNRVCVAINKQLIPLKRVMVVTK